MTDISAPPGGGAMEYPFSRPTGCPFHTPTELVEPTSGETIRRVRIWDGSTPWLVAGNAELHAIAADRRVSADDSLAHFPFWNEGRSAIAPTLPSGILTTDGAEHTRIRRLIARSFAYRRVEAMRTRIQEVTNQTVDALLAGPNPADFFTQFALVVPTFVMCELLGVPYEDHEFFEEHMGASLALDATPEKQQELMDTMLAYMAGLLQSRLDDPMDRGGVLGELVEHIRAGDLSLPEAALLSKSLLLAGHETSANTITLGVAALMQNPEQLAIVRDSDDPLEVANAVEELLRYVNVVQSGVRRIALDDIEIGGKVIRAGEGIILDYQGGNWDNAIFEEPDRLDVHRSGLDKNVSFGFGPHSCVGQQLARTEMQVVFQTVFRRIPTLSFAVPFDELEFKDDRIIYGIRSLPVTW